MRSKDGFADVIILFRSDSSDKSHQAPLAYNKLSLTPMNPNVTRYATFSVVDILFLLHFHFESRLFLDEETSEFDVARLLVRGLGLKLVWAEEHK